jgi:hypothetical protein
MGREGRFRGFVSQSASDPVPRKRSSPSLFVRRACARPRSCNSSMAQGIGTVRRMASQRGGVRSSAPDRRPARKHRETCVQPSGNSSREARTECFQVADDHGIHVIGGWIPPLGVLLRSSSPSTRSDHSGIIPVCRPRVHRSKPVSDTRLPSRLQRRRGGLGRWRTRALGTSLPDQPPQPQWVSLPSRQECLGFPAQEPVEQPIVPVRHRAHLPPEPPRRPLARLEQEASTCRRRRPRRRRMDVIAQAAPVREWAS